MIRRRGWISLVLSGLLLLFAAATVAAVDLDEVLKDAPQEILDIIEVMQGPLSEGAFLIIGRVSFSDGRSIEGGDCPEVHVAFLRGIDVALNVYPDGWFATTSSIDVYYADGGVLKLRAEGHQPVDVPITAEEPIVFIEEVVLLPDNEYVITGIVYDAEGLPIPGLTVYLTYPIPSYCYEPLQSTVTDDAGTFRFSSLSSAEHQVTLGAPYGYVAAWLNVAPHAPETDDVVELTMHPRLQIAIDFVYQPNGTRTLIGPGVITGTATWEAWAQGFDFEDGGPEYYEPEDLRDLELNQDGGEVYFRAFYITGENGFYQASDVGFDDVTVAAESGYGIKRTPCVVGGVYVVRTYSENHYAKFIVRAIEPVP